MTKKFPGLALSSHSPSKIGRLGACDDCFDFLSKDIVLVSANLYSILEMELPLTSADADAIFASTIPQFATTTSSIMNGQSGNLVTNTAAPNPFLMRSVQPFVSVEAQGWTANGVSRAMPTDAVVTPAFDGVVGTAAGTPTDLAQSWMSFGIPTWIMMKELFQAYRMTMPLGNTLILFDELLADVGTTDTHNTWRGYGDALEAIPERVRNMNERLAAISSPTIFVPQTTQNAGTVAAPIIQGVPTPMVRHMYGSLNARGNYGGMYPAPGIMLLPGQSIFLNFVRDSGDSIYYNALIQAVQNRAGFTYAAGLTGVIGTGTTASTTGQALFTKYVSGKARLGTTIGGGTVTPRCILEWYAGLSYQYGSYYCSSQIRDTIDQMGDTPGMRTLLGLGENERPTSIRKSDLLGRLAKARQPARGQSASRSYEILSHLAGMPGIDDPSSEATRRSPREING